MVRVYRIGKPIILEPVMSSASMTKKEFEFNWNLRIAPKISGYPHVVKANTGYANDFIAFTEEEWNGGGQTI